MDKHYIIRNADYRNYTGNRNLLWQKMWVRHVLQSDGPEQGRTGSEANYAVHGANLEVASNGRFGRISRHLGQFVLRMPCLEEVLYKYAPGENMLSGREMNCTVYGRGQVRRSRWIRNVELSCMTVDMFHMHAELALQFKSTDLILMKNLTSESTEKNQTMKTRWSLYRSMWKVFLKLS